jgi:hypothetical protein
MKTQLAVLKLLHADGQNDRHMAKPIGAFLQLLILNTPQETYSHQDITLNVSVWMNYHFN